MKKKQPKVIYKKYGLANWFRDRIEINENLKYNKPLRDYIIKHELGHSDKFDLIHDLKIDLGIIPVIVFVIKNPKTWTDLSPIQFKNKQLIYDLNLSLLYIMIILFGFFSFKLFF